MRCSSPPKNSRRHSIATRTTEGEVLSIDSQSTNSVTSSTTPPRWHNTTTNGNSIPNNNEPKLLTNTRKSFSPSKTLSNSKTTIHNDQNNSRGNSPNRFNASNFRHYMPASMSSSSLLYAELSTDQSTITAICPANPSLPLEDKDVGTYIIELVENSMVLGPAYRKHSYNNDFLKNFRWKPLISFNNICLVSNLILQGWHFSRGYLNRMFRIATGCWHLIFESNSERDVLERKVLTTIFNGIRSMVMILSVFLPISSLCVASMGSFLFIRAAQLLCSVLFPISSILIDWNDVVSVVPIGIKARVVWLMSLPSKIDLILFQGRRYQGREWDRGGNEFLWSRIHDPHITFVWNNSENQHGDPGRDYVSLLENPPPTVAKMPSVDNRGSEIDKSKGKSKSDVHSRLMQSFDVNYLKSKWEKWSGSSTTHVAAVSFCYVMLHEETVNNRISRGRKRRADNKKNYNSVRFDSISIVDDDASGCGAHEYSRKSMLLRSNNEDVEKLSSNVNSGKGALFDCHGNDLKSNTQTSTMDKEVNPVAGPITESIEMHVLDMSQTLRQCLDVSENDSYFDKINFSSELCLSDDDIIAGKDDVEIKSIVSDSDMPWLDVGVKVGKLLLNSAHLQRAMASQETTDRIFGLHAQFGGGGVIAEHQLDIDGASSVTGSRTVPLATRQKHNQMLATESNVSKPIHPIWTSPAAAGSSYTLDMYSPGTEELYSPTQENDTISTIPNQNVMHFKDEDFLPPLSDSPRHSIEILTSPPRYGSPNAYRVPPLSSLSRDQGDLTKCFSEASSIEICYTDCSSSPNRRDEEVTSDNYDAIDHNRYKSEEVVSSIKRNSNKLTELTEQSEKNTGRRYRRSPLKPGVKVAIPLFPCRPGDKRQSSRTAYVMASVISSTRLYVPLSGKNSSSFDTNCLSVTAKMEQFFLRKGEFADLTFRVMDDWGPRYMPLHSKVPVGSCVATKFGVGVLVGWRIEDDCHVIRSLWQRRGPGTALAYLNRHAIMSTIEGAVGFAVDTRMGIAKVLGCVNSSLSYRNCNFVVALHGDMGRIVSIRRSDIISCPGAQFVPVTEHLKEAVNYQMQIDKYYAAVREQRINTESDLPVEHEFKMRWTEWVDIMWFSFLKAADEDKEFDSSVNELINVTLEFLENLDKAPCDEKLVFEEKKEQESCWNEELKNVQPAVEPGFWIMNDLFGGIFTTKSEQDEMASPTATHISVDDEKPQHPIFSKFFQRAFGLLRILMKTFSIARASSVDHPHLKLALAIGYDFLLFFRTVIKIQQRNLSVKSMDEWKSAWQGIVATFGPIKERLERIGKGFAQRMKDQGRRAKTRLLKFVNNILSDERLLVCLELGDWDGCLSRLELALVEANAIESSNLVHYRKTVKFIYDHINFLLANKGGAASRNSEKLAIFARFVQAIASPRRSLFKIICHDDVLDLFERILVRAYYKEDVATRMLSIHAANFHTLRHLRMLKYFPISGRIWIPLLDAADEEFSYLISQLPENSKEFLCPFSHLFTLCVMQFHKINAGDSSRDWLAFLMEEEAASIIHDIDMKLLFALESFSNDVREMMEVLPYYSRIDDDILNLIDEVDLDAFLKEVSEALDDPDLFAQFVREKATIAIERFLNYLPKLSIPVERRELSDGWVLTCRGEDGGDLTLSDVNIKRENLVCQIMGGDTIFFPMFGDDDTDSISGNSMSSALDDRDMYVEESVLDQVKELILQAQKFGCWTPGIGGVRQTSSDPYVAAALGGLPISSVLNSAIDLWRKLELDDDELLEIAIRDVSYQIQLDKEREENAQSTDISPEVDSNSSWNDVSSSVSFGSGSSKIRYIRSTENIRHRFNPRIDPSVLYLEIKTLTLNLLNFQFRIEKNEKKTLFDPVFEGRGTVSLENVSVRLRVNCAKVELDQPGTNIVTCAPILFLQELDVVLGKLRMKVKDTGFGSDWILNKAVDVFEESITRVVEENLRDQIKGQVCSALESLNSYFAVNPNILLNVLGVSLEELDDVSLWT